MSKSMGLLAALAVGLAATGAAAKGLDGKTRMICAATTAVVCIPGGGCVEGNPEAVNLPVFWHMDPQGKVVKSTTAERGERVSAIDSVKVEGGILVLQGSDEGFGWNVSIDTTTGKMLMAGGRDTGYLAFGECTTP